MQLVYLSEYLEQDERGCLAELRNLRDAQQAPLPSRLLRVALERREQALLKELDFIHRAFVTTRVSQAIVVMAVGGEA